MTRVYARRPQQNRPQSKADPYLKFNELDGKHPWQESVPEGYVLYPARKLNNGKIIYFNFELAKEIGLIPDNHPREINKALETIILETFCIQIINEYDQKQNIHYHPSVVRPGKYMATRYLQLQHNDKKGRTSGDGRSIWNGCIQHNGTTWDISSRGTGVTCLAPGAVDAGKPLKTGSTDFGYGCGTADIDELLGSALMAEIFHRQGINTERVLVVIETGKNLGIGVRAGKNLLRPAHLFNYLKQSAHAPLKRATDYLIQRQYLNDEWNINPNDPKKYELFLDEVAESFAHFTAHLDRDYIFAWLDWDGDNVLANAGIIDYGSIRQFGLRHDMYRYDDVDRFSTNLNEQRQKAREIVQVFAQLTNFLMTGQKKPIQDFANHSSLKKFNEHFDYYQRDHFLYQIGLDRKNREKLLVKNRALIDKLFQSYSRLEGIKSKKKMTRVSDGVNRPAILNMRVILADLPRYMYETLKSGELELLPDQVFFNLVIAESASRKDQKYTAHMGKLIREFQVLYWETLARAAGAEGLGKLLSVVKDRSQLINRSDRLTGDGILYVVEALMRSKKRKLKPREIQSAIDRFILEQSPQIGARRENSDPRLHLNRRVNRLFQTMLRLIDGHKESI